MCRERLEGWRLRNSRLILPTHLSLPMFEGEEGEQTTDHFAATKSMCRERGFAQMQGFHSDSNTGYRFIFSIIPCKWAAAFSISSYLYCPARLSADSTPQRWTFSKSP